MAPGRMKSLSSRGSRVQFDVAISLMLIIPLLTSAVLVIHVTQSLDIPAPYYAMCLFGFVLSPAIGFSMVSRYPQLIVRLRGYLEDVVRGVLPEKVSLFARESDVAAVEDALNLVLDTLRKRLQRVEIEKKDLEQELQEVRTLEAIGTLSSGIAHEINTPLQFIRVNLDFLAEVLTRVVSLQNKRDAESEDKPKALTGLSIEQIEAAVSDSQDGIDRIAGIVQALRDFCARGDSHEMRPLNINNAIRSAVELARNEWKTIADLELDLDDCVPEIVCYGGEVKQTIVNILLNASQAIRASLSDRSVTKGKISIASKSLEHSVVITVSDSGDGVPAEVRPFIFSPFFSTRTSEGARGNGLAYAFSTVVNRHGGRLSCRSEPMQGTCFTIELPRVPSMSKQAEESVEVRDAT
jgi:signal transduction histidine kinase